jgi:hypothetical protein
MSRLTASELLELADALRGRPAEERALVLLAACRPEGAAGAALAEMPLGLRDLHLLALFRENFGPTLDGVAPCPACAAPLEVAVAVDDVWVGPGAAQRAGLFEWRAGGWRVTFRLPTTADLMAVQGEADPAEALRARVIAAVEGPEGPAGLAELPQAARAAWEAEVEALDPQAEVRLSLTCAACQHPFRVPLEAHRFLAYEAERRAQFILQEIHLLASAYGWTEDAILALSDARRRRYVELVTS